MSSLGTAQTAVPNKRIVRRFGERRTQLSGTGLLRILLSNFHFYPISQ
jgi:hypothetical protein